MKIQQYRPIILNLYLFKTSGGLAVAVPGELKGYSTIYNLYGGKVPWKSLFEPTIKLCENGIKISERLQLNMRNHEDMIKNDPFLRHDKKSNHLFYFNLFSTYEKPVFII